MRRISKEIATWALATTMLCAPVAGCGMSDDAGSMNMNNNQTPDASISCNMAMTFDPEAPEVGDLVAVDLTVISGTVISSQWEVHDLQNNTINVETRNDGRTAEFVPTVAGTHTVTITATMAEDPATPCVHTETLSVTAPSAKEEVFVIRITPPDLTAAPRQDTYLTVSGHTPVTDLEIPISGGQLVSMEVEGPGQQPLSAYLRLTRTGSRLVTEGYYSAGGEPVESRIDAEPDDIFEVLVIPDMEVELVAPAHLEQMSLDDLTAIALSEGQLVAGSVVDDVGQPVVGTEVVLRCDEVPSTVGVVSDMINGTFSLLARPGRCGLQVVVPETSGLPRLEVDPEYGFDLEAGHIPTVDVSYAPPVYRSFLAEVTDQHGDPLPDAKVTLTSESIGSAAELTVTVDQAVQMSADATGVVRRSVWTDSQGTWASPLELPAGEYEVLVEPAGSANTTITSIDLSTSDATDATLQLSPPALVSGTVLGGDEAEPVAGVEVLATTTLGMGSSVTSTTDASGDFELSLIEGATYRLSFKPPSGSEFARLVDVEVEALDGLDVADAMAAPIVLPEALVVSGTVTSAQSGRGSVLLQVFRQQQGVTPLFQCVTDASGEFTLFLPDPGLEDSR